MAETQTQITQMTQFILNEAKDRAEEITAKALQDFSVEKTKISTQIKDKITSDYARKLKAIDTQAAIARSTAVNKSRIEKIKARQNVMVSISKDAEAAVEQEMKDSAKNKDFTVKLIVQGALMLLEDEVEVRCRAVDDAMVASCFDSASKEYAKAIKEQTGATKSVKLTLDKTVKLPPPPTNTPGGSWSSCRGGVVLACQNGTITIDNTVDSRLGLVMEQAKPTIRKLLFHN